MSMIESKSNLNTNCTYLTMSVVYLLNGNDSTHLHVLNCEMVPKLYNTCQEHDQEQQATEHTTAKHMQLR